MKLFNYSNFEKKKKNCGECAARTHTHDTTRHDTTRHDTTRHDTTRHDTTRHDTTRHDATRRDATRRDATRRDATRHDTTRHDTTRHDKTRQDKTRDKRQETRDQRQERGEERGEEKEREEKKRETYSKERDIFKYIYKCVSIRRRLATHVSVHTLTFDETPYLPPFSQNPRTIQFLILGRATNVELLKQVQKLKSPTRDPWSNCRINSRENDNGQTYYYSGRQKNNSKTICGPLGYNGSPRSLNNGPLRYFCSSF